MDELNILRVETARPALAKMGQYGRSQTLSGKVHTDPRFASSHVADGQENVDVICQGFTNR